MATLTIKQWTALWVIIVQLKDKTPRLVNEMSGLSVLSYLQHVVDYVEFDDRLSSDQVVHHGVIKVMCHRERQHQDQGLQYITYMCWL